MKASKTYGWILLLLSLVSFAVVARGGQPDFLVLGLDGGVASYNSLTSETRSLVGSSRDEVTWRNGVIDAAVAGVDEDSTVTVWVLTNMNDSAYVQPFAAAPAYYGRSLVSGGVTHKYSFSCIFYDRSRRAVAGTARPLAGPFDGLPARAFKAMLHNEQFIDADAANCEVADTKDAPSEFGYFSDQQMRAWFPTHAAEMPTTTTAGWFVPGQSRKLRTYWAGVGSAYVTTPTMFLFLDRTTSQSSYIVYNQNVSQQTFDDAVALQCLAAGTSTSLTGTIHKGQCATGRIGFFLRGSGLVECTLDSKFRVLYADSHYAYLGKSAEDVQILAETERTHDFYRLPLSPQGFGQLQHLPDLPFGPFRMFRIPYEDLPTSGSGHQ